MKKLLSQVIERPQITADTNPEDIPPSLVAELLPNVIGAATETLASGLPFIALSALFRKQLSMDEWRGVTKGLGKINWVSEFKKLGPANFFATFLMTSGQKRLEAWIKDKQDEGILPESINPNLSSIAATGSVGAVLLTAARNAIIASQKGTPPKQLSLAFLLTGAGITIFRDVTWLWAVTQTADANESDKSTLAVARDNTVAATATHLPDLISRWVAGNASEGKGSKLATVFAQLKKNPLSALQGLAFRIVMLNASAFGFDAGHKLGKAILDDQRPEIEESVKASEDVIPDSACKLQALPARPPLQPLPEQEDRPLPDTPTATERETSWMDSLKWLIGVPEGMPLGEFLSKSTRQRPLNVMALNKDWRATPLQPPLLPKDEDVNSTPQLPQPSYQASFHPQPDLPHVTQPKEDDIQQDLDDDYNGRKRDSQNVRMMDAEHTTTAALGAALAYRYLQRRPQDAAKAASFLRRFARK